MMRWNNHWWLHRFGSILLYILVY